MAPRSAIVLVAVGLLAGCGGQETSRLHPKHRNCTSSGAPPVPVIERAWQDGERYRVRVHLAAEPEECKPVKVRVLLSSTLDSGHKLLSTDGLYATFTDGRAEMVFERSVLHLPPYVARAISFTESGHISAGAERRIRETGDYCARHRPVARCIIEAEALAHRCVRGTAPRGQCPARGYGSRRLRPSTPVEGASFEAVVEDVRETLLGGTQDDIRLDAFTCTPKLVCTATYRRDPREGVLRIRYYVSGSDDGPGCWNSQEHDIVEPPYDRARSPLAPYVQRGNMTGCLHWR